MGMKIISPKFEWCIGKFPGFCITLINTSKWYLQYMFFYAVIYMFGTLKCNSTFYAQTELWGL